ncbi:hypothetical protein AAFF_G00356400 [Aldrovandia affinis]|uniref:Uncharacterized protein n=1 Tax=Aldrovandia affinis TaxID=143900 RepID=A0AAD7X0U5_9TELE|nr:hypothetical protein AAFF_G00356400 [Aldrovandia affinis]
MPFDLSDPSSPGRRGHQPVAAAFFSLPRANLVSPSNSWVGRSVSLISPVPTADANVQQVAALFDKVLSLCTASLANAGQAPHQSQTYSRQPWDSSSRRPGGYSRGPQHTRVQPQLSVHSVW